MSQVRWAITTGGSYVVARDAQPDEATETGSIVAVNGRYVMSTPSGRSTSGTYMFWKADSLLLTPSGGPVQTWRRLSTDPMASAQAVGPTAGPTAGQAPPDGSSAQSPPAVAAQSPGASGLSQASPAAGAEGILANQQAAALALTRGKVELLGARYAEAITTLNDAIQLDGRSADAHNLRGVCYLRAGDTQNAISDFDSALSIDPQHGWAQANRGLANYYLTRGRSGQVDLSAALLRMHPEDQARLRTFEHSIRKALAGASGRTTAGLEGDGRDAVLSRIGSFDGDTSVYEPSRPADPDAPPEGLTAQQYYEGAKRYDDPQHAATALRWYASAAKAGHALSQAIIGKCYELGQGLPRDFPRAVYWYRRAAAQDEPIAMTRLGMLYLEGRGMPKDIGQGTRLMSRAAELGQAAAQDMLGQIYENGVGTPQDLTQALTWYYKAAQQGNEDAIQAVARVSREMNGASGVSSGDRQPAPAQNPRPSNSKVDTYIKIFKALVH